MHIYVYIYRQYWHYTVMDIMPKTGDDGATSLDIFHGDDSSNQEVGLRRNLSLFIFA